MSFDLEANILVTYRVQSHMTKPSVIDLGCKQVFVLTGCLHRTK